MDISIVKAPDVIDLIFFKLMFFFDEFQPGNTIYRSGEKGLPKRLETLCKMTNSTAIRSAVKRNLNDESVIGMMQVIDSDQEAGVILEFPLFTDKPRVIIKESGKEKVAFAGDDACRELREGPESEEQEAFEFILKKVNEIIAECTGQA